MALWIISSPICIMTLFSAVQNSTWYSVQQIQFVSNKHHVIPIKFWWYWYCSLAFQFPKILFPSLNLVCSFFLPLLPLSNNCQLMTSYQVSSVNQQEHRPAITNQSIHLLQIDSTIALLLPSDTKHFVVHDFDSRGHRFWNIQVQFSTEIKYCNYWMLQHK